jgi:hypothetical protein
MILSYPFENAEDLLEVDGAQAESFQEAYELCCDNHTHGDDLYDELDVDDDEAESDADDEFEDVNPSQLTVYNLIVDHYSHYLAGRNPPQLRVNLDGVAGTDKTYVLLQASKKVEEMATLAGRKDPVLRAALTGIAAHNFHGHTLHSLFKIPVKTAPQGLSRLWLASNS